MTPSEPSQHHSKTLVPTVERQSSVEQDPLRDTPAERPNTEIELSTDPTSSSDPDLNPEANTQKTSVTDPNRDTKANTNTAADSIVLVRTTRPHIRGVHHAIDEGGRPLCGAVGEFSRTVTSEAREHTTGFCRNCNTAQTGGVDRRTCPTCGQLISVTHWPQHVRTCEGESGREAEVDTNDDRKEYEREHKPDLGSEDQSNTATSRRDL